MPKHIPPKFSLRHDCGRRGRWGLLRHKGTKKMPPNFNERPKAGGKLEKEGRNGSILKNRCINFVSVRLQAMSNVPKSSRKHGIFGWLKGFFFFVDGAAVEPLRKPTLRFLEVLLRKSGLVDKVFQFCESIPHSTILVRYYFCAAGIVFIHAHDVSFAFIHIFV